MANPYSGFDNDYSRGGPPDLGPPEGRRRGHRGGINRRGRGGGGGGMPAQGVNAIPPGQRGSRREHSPPPRYGGRRGEPQRGGPRGGSPGPPLPELFSGYPTYNEIAERSVPGGASNASRGRAAGGVPDAKERPCRTLFLRNIRYETRPAELREKFERMGELKTFYDLIGNRGMVFVTYVRCVRNAYDEMLSSTSLTCERPSSPEDACKGQILAIDIHFSLPKDEDRSRAPTRDNNQGTLFMTLQGNPHTPINDQALRHKMNEFGDVKAIIPFRNEPWQRHVEYFDARAALAAHDALNGQQYLGGILEFRLSWDMEQPAPGEAIVPPRRREMSPRGGMNLPPSVDSRLNEAQRMQELLSNLAGKPAAAPTQAPPPASQDALALLSALMNKGGGAPPPAQQQQPQSYAPPPAGNPYAALVQPQNSYNAYAGPSTSGAPPYQPPYQGYRAPNPQPSYNGYPPASTDPRYQSAGDPRSPPYQPGGSSAQSPPPAGQGSTPGALPPAILALLQQTAQQQQGQGQGNVGQNSGTQAGQGNVQALLAALAQAQR